MRKRRIYLLPTVIIKLSVILIVSCCSIGCASFPGKNLPNYSYSDLPKAPAEKACLIISDDIKQTGRENTIEVANKLEKSGYFLKAPEHCTPTEGMQTKNSLRIDFQNEIKAGNMAVAIVGGFVSGATFLILPGYARDEYVMKAQLKTDKSNKEYVYREHMDTWFHLSMIFLMPGRTPPTTVKSIYDKMIMNFLYDYSHDVQQGELPQSASNPHKHDD